MNKNNIPFRVVIALLTIVFGVTLSFASLVNAERTSTNGNWLTNAINTYFIGGSATVGTTTQSAVLGVWGAGTTTGQSFSVANNASTTSFMVLDNTKVGVATTTPYSQLTVIGPSTEPTLAVRGAANTALCRSATANCFEFFNSANTPFFNTIQATNNAVANQKYPIALNPLGGGVAIGTTTPNITNLAFIVASSTTGTTTVEFGDRYDSGSKTCFNIKRADGTVGSFYFVGTGIVVEASACK